MTDTNTPAEFSKTLSQAVSVALLQAAGDRMALMAARAALKADDIHTVRLIVLNQTAPGTENRGVSIDNLIYECLPRYGERSSGF